MSESDNKSQMQIGKKLHDARVAKGYTLDDLQQATKIQKRYLIAIEDEKFNELPGDFYVQAFVKQYADMVGLDGAELLKDYSDQLPQTKTHEYSEHISQAVETRSSHHQRVERVDRFRQYLPTIIIVIVIIIVLLAIWLTSIARSRRDSATRIDSSSVSVSGKSKESSTKKKAKKVVKKTSTTSAVKLSESTRTNNSVSYTGKALKSSTNLSISTKGASSYVTVNVDGSQRVARTLQSNGSDSVRLAKNVNQIVITVNNPSATTIRIGGKRVNFTRGGRDNNTRRIVITLGGRNASSSSSTSTSTTNGRSTTGTTRTTTTGGTRTTTTTGGTTSTGTGTTGTRTATTGTTGSTTTTTNNAGTQQTTTR